MTTSVHYFAKENVSNSESLETIKGSPAHVMYRSGRCAYFCIGLELEFLVEYLWQMKIAMVLLPGLLL
jgi:hypothetical protein